MQGEGLALLRAAEWSHPTWGDGFCPSCEAAKTDGHQNCPLGLAVELLDRRRAERLSSAKRSSAVAARQ